MNKSIEIIVAPNGSTRVETKGFVGAECRDASRFIETALGKPSDETLKAEFHQTETSQQELRQDQ